MGATASSNPYAAILLVIATAIAAAGSILIITHIIGPKLRGPVKDSAYESGMPPVSDARRRFNVRFYMVAMLFLLFDVEVVFLWPWAPVFFKSATEQSGALMVGSMTLTKGFLLAEIAVFLAVLLVGYVYAWRRGVFRWE